MNSLIPVPVHLPAGVRVTAVAADGDYSLALTSTGSVLAWGENNDGQLGDGTTAEQFHAGPGGPARGYPRHRRLRRL